MNGWSALQMLEEKHRWPVARLAWLVLAFGVAASAAQAQTAVPAKAELCVACHGPGGKSTQPQFPVLAGQTARYMYLQLRDYQEGRRSHELMTPIVAGLSRGELQELADYFSQQAPPQLAFQPDPAKVRLGKEKSDETLCTMCHLGGFKGQNEIPRVAGQHYDYIVKQLSDFKERKRTNDAGNMTSVSRTLSTTDIENLAHYLAGL